MPAVVADGVSGLLTPAGDGKGRCVAVGHLLDDPVERARLAARSS
jgi:hypothetical protein